jgi:hypothetical protein
MLRRLRRLGLRKIPVGRALSAETPFVVVCSATFFCACKNAPHFSLSGAKKRRLPPERYAIFGLKFLEYIRKEYFYKNGLKDVLEYEIM